MIVCFSGAKLINIFGLRTMRVRKNSMRVRKNSMRMRKIIEERRKFLGLVIIALEDIFFSRGEKRRATAVIRSFHERATIVPHL